MNGQAPLRLAATALVAAGLAASASAQELVVNGGFESYSRCPTGIGVIDGYADGWTRGGLGSTDYMNACGFHPVPSRTGDGHAGLIPWDASGPYREYLTGTLVTPLVAGQTYRLDFWVILSEGHLRAVQELGAWFSATRPRWPDAGPPPGIVPQVENATGPLIDKVNWTLVTGTFTATGGEQFLTIGNFHDDAGTTLHEWPCCGSVQSYYHVDDVSLVEAGGAPPPCLWRADATSVRPLDPPASSLFMAPTAEGLSLQGPSWQCPVASGDVEREPDALGNGVPLSFYQIDLATDTLRVDKSGTTLRFRFSER